MHFPDRQRSAFSELVDLVDETGSVPRRFGNKSTTMFLRSFVGCTDITPGPLAAAVRGIYWDTFGVDPDRAAAGTYSRAARRLDEVRRGTTDLVL